MEQSSFVWLKFVRVRHETRGKGNRRDGDWNLVADDIAVGRRTAKKVVGQTHVCGGGAQQKDCRWRTPDVCQVLASTLLLKLA